MYDRASVSYSIQQAGLDCIEELRSHFESRPKPTGIATHDYRPSDVIITTFPKSGTTLTQHMAYQIVALSGGGPEFDRTGLDFPDLGVVSPWIEHIPNIGIKPCESSPRILKTHMAVTNYIPLQSRHIVVVRNPTAYPSSWLDFAFDAIVPNADKIDMDVREAAFHECVRQDLLEPIGEDEEGKWHQFVKNSIFPIRKNVLVMFYEDIVSDMHQAVRRIAKFIGCKLSDDLVDEVVKRCDRDTMGSDPRFFCRVENKCFGITKDQPKALRARSDGFKRFRIKDEDLRQLEDMTEQVFGVRKYSQLMAMVNNIQKEKLNHCS